MNKRIFPQYLVVLIVCIAVLNMFASIFSWYWRIGWLDMFMHFWGGVWVALYVLWFFDIRNSEIKSRNIFLIAFVSVLSVGLIWELFEFGVNAQVVFSEQNNLTDTFSDLIFDLLGAIAASVYFINARQ